MRHAGRVRFAVRIFLLLACVSTLAAWAVTWSSRGSLTVERFRAYRVVSHEGVLMLSVTVRLQSDRASGEERPVAFGTGWRVHTDEGSSADAFLVRLALGRHLGRSFHAVRDLHGLTSGIPGGSPDFDWTRPRTSAVMFPHWAAALVFGAAPALWAVRRIVRRTLSRRRRRAGRCPDCGYDLRASPGQCPECGARAATT
jgi:hypothetical protein